MRCTSSPFDGGCVFFAVLTIGRLDCASRRRERIPSYKAMRLCKRTMRVFHSASAIPWQGGTVGLTVVGKI
jgi:hypothetical protein